MDEAKPDAPQSPERESRLRSVLKALSWRVLATGTTVVIALALGVDWSVALQIGAVEAVAKMIVYYLHERAWAAVPMGTVRNLFPTGSK